MLGVIISGMKKLATSVIKGVGRVAVRSTAFFSRKAAENLRRFGNRMLSNMRSAKWWSKAARFIRKSGIVSTAGNTADALNKSGASNWLTKGLSAFKYDNRSPKEYKLDFDYKTNLIESLKKKRDKLIEEADRIKDELNRPTLSISKIPDVGDKLNALSVSIDQMKAGIAQVKVNQNKTNILLGSVGDELSMQSANLGEAILKTSESNLKTSLTNAEDIKNHNMALHAENSQNIVSEINSHIDEVESNRKAEEEEREKNDWKRKFFLNFLIIMEWILDFPGKIKMLLFKLGIILTLALTTVILKNWNKITEWYNNTWNGGLRTIGSLIVTTISVLGSVIMDLLGLIYDVVYAILNPIDTAKNAWNGDSTVTMFDQASDYLYKVAEDYEKDAFMSKEEREANKLVDIKKDKSELRNNSEASINSIDPNKSSETTNLDVMPNESEAVAKPSTKKDDTDNSKPPELTNSQPVKNAIDPFSVGYQAPAVDPMWTTAVKPDAWDHNSSGGDKSINVNSSDSKAQNKSDNELKEIKSILAQTNDNINITNSNVIKGTHKTMKAASQKPPITTINKIDMKKASPILNTNGI